MIEDKLLEEKLNKICKWCENKLGDHSESEFMICFQKEYENTRIMDVYVKKTLEMAFAKKDKENE